MEWGLLFLLINDLETSIIAQREASFFFIYMIYKEKEVIKKSINRLS